MTARQMTSMTGMPPTAGALGPGLGETVTPIVDCAKRRGLPWLQIEGSNLLQLGYGIHQKHVWGTQTPHTGAIAEGIARNKQMVRTLLHGCGIPVPEGDVVHSADEAWELAQAIGLPVTMKPRDGRDRVGLILGLQSEAEVRRAFDIVVKADVDVIVERHHAGYGHRVLVVDGRVVAVGRDSRPALAIAPLLDPAIDCTDQIHPELEHCCVLAARAIGLDIAGIDVVCCDIAKPLQAQSGVIVDVSAGPDLQRHWQLPASRVQAIGGAIIDHLFPEGAPGRIPIVGITGGCHADWIAWAVAECLQLAGTRSGLACRTGLFVDRRQLAPGPCADRQQGLRLLINRNVEAAVFEHGLHSVLSEGLPYDFCRVAVISGGAAGASAAVDSSRQQLLQIQLSALPDNGVAVLSASDEEALALAAACRGEILLYASDSRHPVLLAHRERGGRAVCLRDGMLACDEGSRETRTLPLSRLPIMDGEAIASAALLAVTGAVWALGLDCAHVVPLLTQPERGPRAAAY